MRVLRLTCAVAALLWLVAVPVQGQAPATDPKFGVIIDGTNTWHQPAYREIANAHLRWVRLHAMWRFIEKGSVVENGNVVGGCSSLQSGNTALCDWSVLESNVNEATSNGLQIYIGVGFFPPPWANDTVFDDCQIHNDACAGDPPTDRRYFQDFVKALVRRFKNRVQYYAIWNEPDLNSTWNSTTTRFVEDILKPGADAVRAAGAEFPAVAVKVIGGEVADSHTMLGNMLSGGTCAKLDIVAVHLFRYDVARNTNHLQNNYIPTIDAQCGNTKTVWVTAFGFPLNKIAIPAGTDPLVHQATLLRNQFASLDAIPRVKRIIFYNMVDPDNPGQETGLLKNAVNGYARKPSFYAIEQYLPTLQTVWVEDDVPTNAVAVGDTDGWNWVTTNPTPLSGTRSHQSSVNAGLHQHYFHATPNTLTINTGDILTAYVYLDPLNPPSTVMLQWNDGSWEHRAYWGQDNMTTWGTNGTASRYPMGPRPELGKWVRLEVPAARVGLEGRTLNGMAFTLYGGRATWDRAGKRPPELMVITSP